MCTNKENIIWIKAYTRIYGFLMSLGFTKSKANSNLYYKVEDDRIMILLVYGDYLFLTGKEKLMSECKKNLALKFKSKDISMMHYFLGLEVWKFPYDIFLNQGNICS